MTDEIEFIYFDLGNVILDFDYEVACRNVAGMTGLNSATIRRLIHGSSRQAEFELGRITAAEFASQFASASGCNLDQDDFLRATSDMFSLNRQIVPLLTQLQACRFPMGILSNTCSAHWEFVEGRFPLVFRMFPRRNCILSYESKSMKPDGSIFADAIKAAGCTASRIFFTDDRPEHVAAARQQSMDAEIFESVPKLLRNLTERGIRINL